MDKKNEPSYLSVKIITRENILFDGKAISITGINDKGIFDVLPEHINFITLIFKSLTIHTPDGKTRKITIDRGVLKVESNSVEIYSIEPKTTTIPN